MNNDLNQDNYLLNQNTQQQYLNIQSYQQQGGETQRVIDFEYTLEFQDPKIRTDFVRKVYVLLTLEFFITFLLIALGFCSGMGEWLFIFDYRCSEQSNSDIYVCNYYFGPTWLFYVSLVISIVLQISLYFGGSTLRKDSYSFMILIPQLIFFGFTFATICISATLQIEPINILISIVITFLIIISQTIYLNLDIRDLSFKICTIIIICIVTTLLIILSCMRRFLFLECFLCSLFSLFYGFYLMFETKLMMCRGTLKLQTCDCLFGSLLLNALMIQPLVRIIDMIYNATGGRQRK